MSPQRVDFWVDLTFKCLLVLLAMAWMWVLPVEADRSTPAIVVQQGQMP